LSLESDVDNFDRIHEIIEKDIIFKGTNLWILMFAIMVASVGLNMNSTAVIIGAMLISPLMGPINGIGYSIATYNFPLLRKAFKNLLFAVAASLFASTLYFTISPISTAHSELLARTSPSIYDVLIALFGGLAGILAISSKLKGNVIPGVAIATALMPPLCTAGYGLATWQLNFFLGAFYLFTINTVFIALSSVLISQLLNFPIRTLVDSKQKKITNQLISLITVLVFIPSIYFGYVLVQNERFLSSAKFFTNNVQIFEGNYLLKNEIFPRKKTIKLVYGGSPLSDIQKQRIIDRLKDFKIEEATIEFQQGLALENFPSENSETEQLRFEINNLKRLISEKDEIIKNATNYKLLGKDILAELISLYPQISACAVAESMYFDQNKNEELKLILIEYNGNDFNNDDKRKLNKWLKSRLKTEKMLVFYNNSEL